MLLRVIYSIVDENRNHNIQRMFSTEDPDEVTEIFVDEMHKAAKKLVIKNRFQIKKHSSKFWTRKLEAQKCQINFWNNRFRASKDYGDW